MCVCVHAVPHHCKVKDRYPGLYNVGTEHFSKGWPLSMRKNTQESPPNNGKPS